MSYIRHGRDASKRPYNEATLLVSTSVGTLNYFFSNTLYS